jgi:hypothetical protein
MPKLKTALRTIRQTLVILLITLVLAEVAFRVFNYFRPSFIFPDYSYNQFRGRPHYEIYGFKLNSKGFRDVEFSEAKAEGTYRVLGLGDSFTFGVVPYQHNYLTVLEEELNNRGRRVEIINMGIPGIGPKDYLAVLTDEGLELNPDMVLLSFFIGNDFLREEQERSLYSYSYVASFINFLIIANQEQLAVSGSEYKDNEPTFSDAKFVSLESDRSEIYRKQNPSFEADFAEAIGYVARIKRLCDERNISFAVVLIPDEVQVSKAVQSRVLLIKGFNASPEDFDFTLPNRLMAAKLREQNINFIDLLDGFAAASAQANLYKPNDTHWNIAGNRLAAELIHAGLFGGPPAQGAVNRSALGAERAFYEGFHEATDCSSIKGWAWDTARPDSPVRVEIYDGETLVDTVTADVFRADLKEARKGNGAHGFEYRVPARLKDGRPHAIRLKVAGTEIKLNGTPKLLDCGPE